MLCVSACFHALASHSAASLQGFVQAVPSGCCHMKRRRYAQLRGDIRGEGLFVIGLSRREGRDAQLVELLGKQPHGAEKGHDLLDAVPSVIRFRADFHHHEQPRRYGLPIQLWSCSIDRRNQATSSAVASRHAAMISFQFMTPCFSAPFRAVFHLIPAAPHFLRQENGRWQTTQVLSGGNYRRGGITLVTNEMFSPQPFCAQFDQRIGTGLAVTASGTSRSAGSAALSH